MCLCIAVCRHINVLMVEKCSLYRCALLYWNDLCKFLLTNRTDGPSDQREDKIYFVGLAGCRINGLPDQRAVGPTGLRANRLSDQPESSSYSLLLLLLLSLLLLLLFLLLYL